MSITKVSDFSIADVSVSEVKKNKAGGEAAYLKCNEDSIILQTDILKVVNNQDNTVELNIDGTKFSNLISAFESIAETTFGEDEEENKIENTTLRTCVSDNNSIKLNIIDGKTMMFDSKKNKTDVIEVESNVQILVQPAGIWCKNKEYGVSFRLLQVKVLDKEESLQEYAFVDDDNDYYDVVPNDF